MSIKNLFAALILLASTQLHAEPTTDCGGGYSYQLVWSCTGVCTNGTDDLDWSGTGDSQWNAVTNLYDTCTALASHYISTTSGCTSYYACEPNGF